MSFKCWQQNIYDEQKNQRLIAWKSGLIVCACVYMVGKEAPYMEPNTGSLAFYAGPTSIQCVPTEKILWIEYFAEQLAIYCGPAHFWKKVFILVPIGNVNAEP